MKRVRAAFTLCPKGVYGRNAQCGGRGDAAEARRRDVHTVSDRRSADATRGRQVRRASQQVGRASQEVRLSYEAPPENSQRGLFNRVIML